MSGGDLARMPDRRTTATPEVRPEIGRDVRADVRPEVAGLVERLARLLTDAAVYPPEHSRVVRQVGEVLGGVRALGRGEDGFCIDVRAGELLVEGVPVPVRNAVMQRLLADLENLGAVRLDLLPGVCGDDLFALAHFFRSQARRPAALRFGEADLSGLPPAVRIRQHAFGLASLGAGDPSQNSEAGDGKLERTREERPRDPAPLEAPVAVGSPADDSDGDLEAAIATFVEGATPFGLAAGAEPEPAVALSILFHLLSEARDAADAQAAFARLDAALSEGLDDEGLAVAAGWVRDVAASPDVAGTDAVLGVVAAPLRRAGRDAFARVCLAAAATGEGEAAQTPAPAVATALWPHLANEVLLGLGTEGRSILDRAHGVHGALGVDAILAAVPPVEVRRDLPRLLALSALRTGPLAPGAFFPPRPALDAICEALLDCRAAPPEATRAILEAYRLHPPAHPCAGALVALRAPDDSAKAFLARLLRDCAARDAQPSGETAPADPAVERFAVEVLIERLAPLSRTARGESWVPLALAALARMPGERARKFVRRVRRGRR